jgi:hypothetical protein
VNKAFVLQQLREADVQLGNLIKEMEADRNGFGPLYALLPFVYRNLNLAWNSTKASDEEIDAALKQESQPAEWWGFPKDLDLLMHD